jgi:hypothetical protein
VKHSRRQDSVFVVCEYMGVVLGVGVGVERKLGVDITDMSVVYACMFSFVRGRKI